MGVYNKVYYSRTSLWIVKRSAVDIVCETAANIVTRMIEEGCSVRDSVVISYVMQMLCSNPKRHLMKNNAELWSNMNHDNVKLKTFDYPAVTLNCE